jgi:uncharacterized protein
MHSNPAFPPCLVPFAIPSNGALMLARMLLAAGPGPHPTAVFLHGLPGNEQNTDLAHAVRNAGWNALVFNYRGSWGSEGDYSLTNVADDACAAIEFTRSATARELRCDPSRIALIGHSTGGFAAILAASRGYPVKGVASLAGFNFGAVGHIFRKDETLRQQWTDAFRTAIRPLKGITAEGLISEIMTKAEAFQLESAASLLTKVKIFLVWCAQDYISIPEIHQHPLLEAFKATDRKTPCEVLRLETDHYISEGRDQLKTELIRWLKTLE